MVCGMSRSGSVNCGDDTAPPRPDTSTNSAVRMSRWATFLAGNVKPDAGSSEKATQRIGRRVEARQRRRGKIANHVAGEGDGQARDGREARHRRADRAGGNVEADGRVPLRAGAAPCSCGRGRRRFTPRRLGVRAAADGRRGGERRAQYEQPRRTATAPSGAPVRQGLEWLVLHSGRLCDITRRRCGESIRRNWRRRGVSARRGSGEG